MKVAPPVFSESDHELLRRTFLMGTQPARNLITSGQKHYIILYNIIYHDRQKWWNNDPKSFMKKVVYRETLICVKKLYSGIRYTVYWDTPKQCINFISTIKAVLPYLRMWPAILVLYWSYNTGGDCTVITSPTGTSWMHMSPYRLHSWDNISPINKYVENILRICWGHIEGARLLTMSWLPKISRTGCPQCRSRRCQRRWDHHPLQGGWQQSGAPCPATPRWDNKYNIIYII